MRKKKVLTPETKLKTELRQKKKKIRIGRPETEVKRFSGSTYLS